MILKAYVECELSWKTFTAENWSWSHTRTQAYAAMDCQIFAMSNTEFFRIYCCLVLVFW